MSEVTERLANLEGRMGLIQALVMTQLALTGSVLIAVVLH